MNTLQPKIDVDIVIRLIQNVTSDSPSGVLQDSVLQLKSIITKQDFLFNALSTIQKDHPDQQLQAALFESLIKKIMELPGRAQQCLNQCPSWLQSRRFHTCLILQWLELVQSRIGNDYLHVIPLQQWIDCDQADLIAEELIQRRGDCSLSSIVSLIASSRLKESWFRTFLQATLEHLEQPVTFDNYHQVDVELQVQIVLRNCSIDQSLLNRISDPKFLKYLDHHKQLLLSIVKVLTHLVSKTQALSVLDQLTRRWSNAIEIMCISDHWYYQYICMMMFFLLQEHRNIIESSDIVAHLRECIIKGIPYYLDLPDLEYKYLALAVAQKFINTLPYPCPGSDVQQSLDFQLEECQYRSVQFVLNYDPNAEMQSSEQAESLKVDRSQDESDSRTQSDHYQKVDKYATTPSKQSSRGRNYVVIEVTSDSDDDLDPMDLPEKIQLAAPTTLNQCVQYMKLYAKSDDRQRLELVLKAIPNLVNCTQSKRELSNASLDLCHRILYVSNDYGLKDFEQLRIDCLCALLQADPKQCGRMLIDEFWNSKGLSLGGRSDVMDVLIKTSRSLSSTYQAEFEAQSSGKTGFEQSLDVMLNQLKLSSSQSQLMKEGDVKRFHPLSSHILQQHSERENISKDIVKDWIKLLSRGLFTSKLEWLRQECQTVDQNPLLSEQSHLAGLTSYVSKLLITNSAESEYTQSRHVQVTTAQLLAKWMTTLCILIRSCGSDSAELDENLTELGRVFGWYWQFCQSAKIKLHDGQKLIKLINYPNARQPLLLALSTALEIADDSYYVGSRRQEVLPFNWQVAISDNCERFDVNQLVNWLIDDVWQNDSSSDNRYLASFILQKLKSRLQLE
ncbi:hypothetical protein MP228_000113 [Amoeboaphelidium protococcarum]|nr:hypothetical protein MP228_000113 [Amoeboaphelidium protococcarum]